MAGSLLAEVSEKDMRLMFKQYRDEILDDDEPESESGKSFTMEKLEAVGGRRLLKDQGIWYIG